MILLDITNKNEQKTFNIMQFGYKKKAGYHVITRETISLVLIFAVISVYLIL